MQPSQPQPAAKFSGDHNILMESRFMTPEPSGKKLRLSKDCGPFAATIRLIVNGDLLGNPGREAMHKYLVYQLVSLRNWYRVPCPQISLWPPSLFFYPRLSSLAA